MKERFADIQMLRYKLNGFESLTLRQKLYIYYLAEATLWGRDITFDQFGKYNLAIRKAFESIILYTRSNDAGIDKEEMAAIITYTKRVWFSNGIYHHYSCDKFIPEFTEASFRQVAKAAGVDAGTLDDICPVIFNPTLLPKRVNKADNEDVIATSACNFYENVSQEEVEAFYNGMKQGYDAEPPSYGLNSTLIKDENSNLKEVVWKIDGKYGNTIQHIIDNLALASQYAENERQKEIISLLIEYYTYGDLRVFDKYSIEWIKETDGDIDFINGFIEVYGDPLGFKASWEGLVEYKDHVASARTEKICQNAQWFEDNSPVAPQFKKPVVKGVTANVICAAMLGGDEYPSTAIGINLPNADWIRSTYGSKSITISNITEAYDEASKGNGFMEEFVVDGETVDFIRKYGYACDNLHTDLHECLGHGSGQLLPGTDANALKNYSSTIEEARADLFALYYIADRKLIDLGLLESEEAYKSQYYTYLMNGLLTQGVRIKLGDDIEEAHMRNRALIANWTLEHGNGALELVQRDGKTYLNINDYVCVRALFATLLAEIQRIKSEGDYEAARVLVEKYGVKLNREIHEEILSRYAKLNIAPYKGFLNPQLNIVRDAEGNPVDVKVSYEESMEEQMLRYSKDYSVEGIK